MKNPFESGHIKNYILLYVSVVVVMVLFFAASTIFRDNTKVDKKVFSTDATKSGKVIVNLKETEQNSTRKFKLLDKVY